MYCFSSKMYIMFKMFINYALKFALSSTTTGTRLTKQGKLVCNHKFMKVLMGVKIFAGDQCTIISTFLK